MWMTGYNDDAAEEFNSTIQDPLLRPLVPRASRDHFLAAAMVEERDKRPEMMTTQQVVVTSRWNPTSEQLQTLEELYQRGTRTPSADQIQQITSQLRRYGKIEGKNVFYWFQNHKARERQKRRRQLESLSKGPGTGSNTSEFEVVEPTKNSASPTNSTTISMKTTRAGATKGADGWVQFDIAAAEQMLSQRRRNATWQMHKRPHDNFINVFDSGPCFNPHHHEAQTLQLFPVESVRHEQRAQEEGEGASSSGSNASDNVTTPYRFFEFLPLKN